MSAPVYRQTDFTTSRVTQPPSYLSTDISRWITEGYPKEWDSYSIRAIFDLSDSLGRDPKKIIQWLNVIEECIDEVDFKAICYSRLMSTLVDWKRNPSTNLLIEFFLKHNPKFLEKWFKFSQSILNTFCPLQLTNVVHGLAALDARPPEAWIQAWYMHSMGKLYEFNSRLLSTSFYSIAQLGSSPSSKWLQVWYTHSIKKLASTLR